MLRIRTMVLIFTFIVFISSSNKFYSYEGESISGTAKGMLREAVPNGNELNHLKESFINNVFKGIAQMLIPFLIFYSSFNFVYEKSDIAFNCHWVIHSIK